MKTRSEVIKEILAQHRKHNPTEQAATLEAALQSMQDALLFSLAQDLNISLEAKSSAKEVALRILPLVLILAMSMSMSACNGLRRLMGQEDDTQKLTQRKIDGVWTGNTSHTGAVTGLMTLTFTQTGNDLSGTYKVMNGGLVLSSGTVSGTLTQIEGAAPVMMTFTQTAPCAGSLDFDAKHDGRLVFTLSGTTGCYDPNDSGTLGSVTPTRWY